MKKILLLASICVVLLIVLGMTDKSFNLNFLKIGKTISVEEAKAKASKFISENLVQPGTPVDIKSVTEENGLYKIDLNVGGQDISAYMTRDGKKFFPSVMEMEAAKESSEGENGAEQKDIPRADVPDVKLFVMSYCPYGTQIEKGILPVLDVLGDKIKFDLKFVDYAMHDKKEMDENTRQYCIQKNEPAKLNSYMKCFLKKGQGTEEACLGEAGANSAQVASCVKAADAEFKITENYNNKSTWNSGQYPPYNIDKEENEKYGVQGSPTLVINETEAKSGRDSASLLKTICGAFNNPPEECNAQLSSASPAAGFGEGTGSGGSASCEN